MGGRLWQHTAPLLLATALVGGATTLAQSIVAQLGVTEDDARHWVLETMKNGGPSPGGIEQITTAAQAGFKKLPASARGTAVTALYAWTKSYLNTAEFKTAYAARRADVKPVPRVHEGTVDDELKATLAKMRSDNEASLQALAKAGQSKEQIDAMRKTLESTVSSLEPVFRGEITDTRAKDKADYDMGMKQWQELFPADPMQSVARILREFLAATPDVDFAAKQKFVQGEGGEGMIFVDDAYNKKPWQWKEAYNYGPEAIAAARAAATAWVKEAGGQ
jgi:hypothetical protein